MNTHDHTKPLRTKHQVRSLGFAAATCALALLGGHAAHAGSTQITSASQLGVVTFTTTPFPGAGQTSDTPSPLTLMAGLDAVTFAETTGGVFSTNIATRTNGIDFAPGTKVLQTADANNVSLGPLNLTFSALGVKGVGVAGFGLNVQDFAFDQETFTLKVYGGTTGSNLLDTYTYGPYDNTEKDPDHPNGRSVFIGAVGTDGTLITKAVVSSFSFDQGVETSYSNNIFVSPVTVASVVTPAAVPEASTTINFGMGLLCLGGLGLGVMKRKAAQAEAA